MKGKAKLLSPLLLIAMLFSLIAGAITVSVVGTAPAPAHASPQPAEVWVDDDYCDGCPNDGHTWGYDAFATIQDGIDAVTAPGTVHVAAGTYDESITLTNGVHVLGAGADVTTIDGSTARGGLCRRITWWLAPTMPPWKGLQSPAAMPAEQVTMGTAVGCTTRSLRQR